MNLSDPSHVILAAEYILKGKPVVIDYGSTFGTAFTPSARDKIARLRKEKPPLATVSIVTTYDQTMSWIDHSRLHLHIKQSIDTHALKFLENLTFIRVPANKTAAEALGTNYVNSSLEIQVFIVPDNDPVITGLISIGHPPYYAVRSSNMTGMPEEYTIRGAYKYAANIEAPVFLTSGTINKKKRKRFGSQPILHILPKTDKPEIVLRRSGNTHPEAIEIIVRQIFPNTFFTHSEEKVVNYRKPYHPGHEGSSLDAESVRSALLSAAGII